jgi:N-acetylmuramoyl-L-alanine amidase
MGVKWICVCLVICLLVNVTGCTRATEVSAITGVVLIDPGHGGFDGGTTAEDGTIEKHLNLAVSLCLRDLLFVCGVPVAMTRDTDVGLEEDSSVSIRQRKVSDMKRRLGMYEIADVVISIHQNYFAQPQYSGTQLFYAPNNLKSVVLAEEIRRMVVGWIQPQNTRELKAAGESIYLLHRATKPVVLVECGFLSNYEEREKLKTPAYQQQLAFAIMAGYWNYRSET